jgi:hypothetical protein
MMRERERKKDEGPGKSGKGDEGVETKQCPPCLF